MTRKLKVLGLTLVAVFAMSAVVASSASALHFTSEAATTELKGEQTEINKFTILGGTGVTECTTATFSGSTAAATVTEVTVIPVYKNCTSLGETATVDMNSCDYKLTIPNAANVHNPVHIECSTAGDKIVVTAPGCEITIFPQTPTGGGVVYETGGAAGATHDIVVNSTVTGIHYTLHKGCLLLTGQPTEHTFTDGTYTGKVTVRGFSGGKQVGITAT
jgi:hypothetical protein